MTQMQGFEVLALSILMMIEMFFRTVLEIITTFPMACIFLFLLVFGIAGGIGNAMDMRRYKKLREAKDHESEC